MSWLQCTNIAVTKRNNKILLVIAHPDDEVMFFSPLLKVAESAYLLCLSDGNDEGLGSTRSEELIKCGELFGIKKENITIVRHAQLQDGMHTSWPSDIISNLVLDHVKLIQPEILVTFDERGVSDHPNHIATYKGVLLAYSQLLADKSKVVGLKLQSKNTLRKFLGPFDILFSLWFGEYVIVSFGLSQTLQGMQLHASQNKLYRQVFVVLSSFTYINTFTHLKDDCQLG